MLPTCSTPGFVSSLGLKDEASAVNDIGMPLPIFTLPDYTWMFATILSGKANKVPAGGFANLPQVMAKVDCVACKLVCLRSPCGAILGLGSVWPIGIDRLCVSS